MNQTEEACECIEEDVDEKKPPLNDVQNANNHDDHGSEDLLSQADDDMDLDSSITSSPKNMVKSDIRVADESQSELPNGEEFSKEKSSNLAEDDDSHDQDSDGSKSSTKHSTPVLPNIAIRKSEDLLAETNYNLIQNRLQELYKKCKGNPTVGRSPSASQLAFSSQRSNLSYQSEKRSIRSQLESGVAEFPARQPAANSKSERPTNEEVDDDDDDYVEGSDDDRDLRVNPENFDWSDGFENPEVEEEVEPVGGTRVKAPEEEDNASLSEHPNKQKQPRQKISDYFKKTHKKGSATNSNPNGVNSANKAQKMKKSEVNSDSDRMNSSSDMIRDAEDQEESIGIQNRPTSFNQHKQSRMSGVMHEPNSEPNHTESPTAERKSLRDRISPAREFTPNRSKPNNSTRSKQSEKMLKPILTEGGRMGSNRGDQFHSQSGQHGFDVPRTDSICTSGRNFRSGSTSQMLRPVLTDTSSRSYTSPSKQKTTVTKQQMARKAANRNPDGNFALSDEQNSRDSSCSLAETAISNHMTSSVHEYQPRKLISADTGIYSSQSGQNSKYRDPQQRNVTKEMARVQYSGKEQSESPIGVYSEADQNSGREHQPLKRIMTDTGIHSSRSGQNSKHRVNQQRKSTDPENERSRSNTGTNDNVRKPEVADRSQQNRANVRAVGSTGNSHETMKADPNPRLHTTRNKVVTQKRGKAVVNDRQQPVGDNSNADLSNDAPNAQNMPHKTGRRNLAVENRDTFDSEDSSPEAPNARKKRVVSTKKIQKKKPESNLVEENFDAEFSNDAPRMPRNTGGQSAAADGRGSFDSEDSSPEAANASKKRVVSTKKTQKKNPEFNRVEENFDAEFSNDAPRMPRKTGGQNAAADGRGSFDSEDSSPEASKTIKKQVGLKGKAEQNKYADRNSQKSQTMKLKNSQTSQDSGSQLRRSTRLSSKEHKPNLNVDGSGSPTSSEESEWDSEGSDPDTQSSDVEKNKKPKTAVGKSQNLPSDIPASLRNLGVQVQWSKAVPKNGGNGSQTSIDPKKVEPCKESKSASQRRSPLHQNVSSHKEAEAAVKHLPGIQIQRSKPVQNAIKNSSPHLAPVGSNNSEENVTKAKSALRQKNQSSQESLTSRQTNRVHQELPSQEQNSRQGLMAASVRQLPGIKQVKNTDRRRRSPTPELSESELQGGDLNESETVDKSQGSNGKASMTRQMEPQTDGNPSSSLQSHSGTNGNPALPSQNHAGQGIDYASDHSHSRLEQDESDWNSSDEESHYGTGEVAGDTPKPKPALATPSGMNDQPSAAQHLSKTKIQQPDTRTNTRLSVDDGQRDVDKPNRASGDADFNLHSESSKKPTLSPDDIHESNFNTSENTNKNGSFDSLSDSFEKHSNQDSYVMSDATSGKSVPAKRPKKAPVKGTNKNACGKRNARGSASSEYNTASGSQQNDSSSLNVTSRPKKPLAKKGSGNDGKISPKNIQVQTSNILGLPPFQESFPSVPSAHLGRSSQGKTEEHTSMNQEVRTVQEKPSRPSLPAASDLKKTNLLACDTDSNDSFNVTRRRKEDEHNNVIPESDDSSSHQMAEVFPAVYEESPPRPLAPVAVADGVSVEMTPEKSYVELESGEKTYTNLDAPRIPKLPQKSKSISSRTPKSARQGDFPNEDFQGSQRDTFQCVLCPQRFGSAGELEAHAAAGHIVCSSSASCAGLSFDSPASLAHHQSLVHQQFNQQRPAVQRVQVEKLPQAFADYPLQGDSYGSPSTNFNGPKLGSQRSTAPPKPAAPSLPNLPSGIQLTKRPAPSPEAAHSPSKLSRGDNGMPRLPGGITLVKSQPATPPKIQVADMLASRGITMVSKMVASGIPGNLPVSIKPASPAKRLPALPAGISISSSRPQSSSSSSAQRFVVPPAPARGRPVTNSGSVDLTRNNTNRMPGGRVPMAPPSRTVTCAICDKAFASQELLQAHMTVHGGQPSRGRFVCEICRVIYPNEAKLAQHKRSVHPKPAIAEATGPEFVIPICDISQIGVKQKLLQCGIRHVVQLSCLRNANDSGTFGLPIIPIDLARNEAFSRLDDLGASNILSLGTLKSLGR